jgi:hypothetical protein
MKYLGFFNDIILVFHILLHEYKHSIQLESIINECYSQSKFVNTINDIRNIPAEKEADEFAFNFIEEHWNFLCPGIIK